MQRALLARLQEQARLQAQAQLEAQIAEQRSQRKLAADRSECVGGGGGCGGGGGRWMQLACGG